MLGGMDVSDDVAAVLLAFQGSVGAGGTARNKHRRLKMRVGMRVGSENVIPQSLAKPCETRHSKNTCGCDPGAIKKALIQAVERL
jgi:hypothetical protein